jgi:GNAT superfamily N-acetyltransferase
VRRELDQAVEIRRLTPADADPYLAFFDGEAFPDNPAWASCYCLSYNLDLPPRQFDERTATENRSEKGARIRRGDASGVLALSDVRIVGWCNAGPRAMLPLLDRTPGFETDDAANTGAIVCFVIAPPYRGQGLAKRLLDGACDLIRERGLARVEAYPPAAAAGDARLRARARCGPLRRRPQGAVTLSR